MKRRNLWIAGWGMVAAAVGATACAQQQGAAAPAIEEKTFSLAPPTARLKSSFLTGEIKDLRVIERVEAGTGKAVDTPKLRGTLKLKNDSADQAARLIAGRIDYVDAAGKSIALADGSGDASFKFQSYTTERLDPGMEMSQDIDVPFPAAALDKQKLGNLRLELSYIPTPYREDTVAIPVTLSK